MNYIEYTVKKGDSLYEIGQKYNVNANDLMKYNNLISNVLYPNQIIYVPIVNKPNENFYLTKKYDTIESISKKTNTSIEDLFKLNNIEKMFLEDNQKILLNERKDHIVKNDDSINNILKRYNLSVDELVDLNKSEWFRPGNSLKIK